jgi:hypothetical protein
MSEKKKDWFLTSVLNKRYGIGQKDTAVAPKTTSKNRPAKASNGHQATIMLINKILFDKGVKASDSIRVDTLRLLAYLLEENKGDQYVEKEFTKFLLRDDVKTKKSKQKSKATGGWVTN